MIHTDMTLEKAYFCPQCDVITTALNCMRCTGATYPLSRWFTRTAPVETPEPAEPTCVTYKIRLGREDEDDRAYFCEDTERFTNRYMTEDAAVRDLADSVGMLISMKGSMYTRLALVVSAWEQANQTEGKFVWCISQVMPKIVQKNG